jgi:hypothetical protein
MNFEFRSCVSIKMSWFLHIKRIIIWQHGILSLHHSTFYGSTFNIHPSSALPFEFRITNHEFRISKLCIDKNELILTHQTHHHLATWYPFTSSFDIQKKTKAPTGRKPTTSGNARCIQRKSTPSPERAQENCSKHKTSNRSHLPGRHNSTVYSKTYLFLRCVKTWQVAHYYSIFIISKINIPYIRLKITPSHHPSVSPSLHLSVTQSLHHSHTKPLQYNSLTYFSL